MSGEGGDGCSSHSSLFPSSSTLMTLLSDGLPVKRKPQKNKGVSQGQGFSHLKTSVFSHEYSIPLPPVEFRVLSVLVLVPLPGLVSPRRPDQSYILDLNSER